MHPLLGFYETGRREGGFEAGIRDALSGILASPWFLYRVEAQSDQVRTGTAAAGTLKRSDTGVALVVFLVEQHPDDELLGLAADNKLSDPQVLQEQVRRMLADPRSKAPRGGFAFQWLNLARLRRDRSGSRTVAFASGALDPRPLFKQELSLFLDSMLRTDQPVTGPADGRLHLSQ